MQKALRYLGYRPRSIAEVDQYLRQRGFSQANIETALTKLRSYNYLDDEKFAHDWAHSRAHGNGYGPRRIEQELRLKGLDAGVVRQALREVENLDNQKERAANLLARRFGRQDLNNPQIRRRAIAFLVRRGYNTRIAFELLRQHYDEC